MQKIYSIMDKQSNTYGRPFTTVNDVLAQRMYSQLKDDPQSDLHKYPQDYKLTRLGSFDPHTGQIVSEIEDLPS